MAAKNVIEELNSQQSNLKIRESKSMNRLDQGSNLKNPMIIISENKNPKPGFFAQS